MDKYTVTCFFENSEKVVEFFGFSYEELQKVIETKAKSGLFVNKDFRGTIVIIDMTKITHIHALLTY